MATCLRASQAPGGMRQLRSSVTDLHLGGWPARPTDTSHRSLRASSHWISGSARLGGKTAPLGGVGDGQDRRRGPLSVGGRRLQVEHGPGRLLPCPSGPPDGGCQDFSGLPIDPVGRRRRRVAQRLGPSRPLLVGTAPVGGPFVDQRRVRLPPLRRHHLHGARKQHRPGPFFAPFPRCRRGGGQGQEPYGVVSEPHSRVRGQQDSSGQNSGRPSILVAPSRPSAASTVTGMSTCRGWGSESLRLHNSIPGTRSGSTM